MVRTSLVSGILSAECRRLAESADRQYRHDITTMLYLAGKKDSAGVWRVIQAIPEEDADGVWLDTISPTPIPRNMTTECLADWFERRLRHEPLGIIADAAK